MTVAKIAKAKTHHTLCLTKSATRPSVLDKQSDDGDVMDMSQSINQNTAQFDTVISCHTYTPSLHPHSVSLFEGKRLLARQE